MTQALARSGANESLPATITRIERAIEAAATPEQIRKVIALADAAVAFANTYFKEQREMIQRAKSVKLQAERKLGEILAAMPKNTGAKGNPGGRGCAVPDENRTLPTLADLGIDKKVSARAQKLAALPAEQFAAVVAGDVPVSRVVASKPALSRRALQPNRHVRAVPQGLFARQRRHAQDPDQPERQRVGICARSDRALRSRAKKAAHVGRQAARESATQLYREVTI